VAVDTAKAATVILANDRIHDWLVAFLDSFRAHNPEMALKVLPYDGRTATLKPLAARYRFELVDYDFTAIDRFAKRLYPFSPYHRLRLRKLAAFDIDVETIIYTDVDTIVLHDFAPLTGLLRPQVTEFIYASDSPDWVYKPNYREIETLRDAVLFSDGFFVTSPRFISSAKVMEAVSRDLPLFRSIKVRRGVCQPVINFAVHTLGLKLRSVAEVTGEFSNETFYMGDGITAVGGQFFDPDNKKMLLMHWAGPKKRGKGSRFQDLWKRHYDSHHAGGAPA
jgi:hypothetical protein